jgi:hypothetical protein
LLLTVLICCGAEITCAQTAVPQAFPKGRYDQLSQHSPFSLATIQPPAAPAGPGFADNWYVSGIGGIGDDTFVTIKSRDLSTNFSLYANEPDPKTGVSVASVNWSDTIGKSTVILRKGTETAKLEFNEAEIHAAPAAANPKGAPNGIAKGPAGGTPAGGLPAGARPINGAQGTPTLPIPNQPPGVNPAFARPGSATPPVHHRSQVIQPPQ